MRNILLILIVASTLSNCKDSLYNKLDVTYESLPEKIDFNYHVKPILSDKCFACHGPDKNKQEANLRLDLPENAYAALVENPDLHAIVPGKIHKSEIVNRILSSDENLVMPPPESNLTLNDREKALILKWIEQGAPYQKHWSLIKPVSASIPKVKNESWTNNEIDFFVLNTLEKNQLKPSEKASKEILIRRLYFSLIGLPPTIEEIEHFCNDKSSNAYEKLVDKLLSSPNYGERMAADWMDVARYSESDGYLDDKHREFSPYRDWVINAFNKNMGYDTFVTHQLAGDLIDKPTKESILATAFNRLHKKNSEAGIVFEEFRQEYVSDRTLTVGKAFMGLSVECARCHDHKYDPITQKNYYEIAAFFNSTNELGTAIYGPGQTPGPSLLLTNDEQDKLLAYLNRDIVSTEKAYKVSKEGHSKEYESWSSDHANILKLLESNHKQGLIGDFSFDHFTKIDQKNFQSPNNVTNGKSIKIKEPDIRAGLKNKGVFINDFTTVALPEKMGWFDYTDPFTVSVAVHPDTIYTDAGLFYHCEDLRLGLKGYSLFLEENRPKFIMAHSWPNEALQITAIEAIPIKKWSTISLTYDGFGKAEGIGMYINGNKVPVEINNNVIRKSILFEPDVHTYGFQGFTLGERDKMKTFINGGIDDLKIYNKELSALELIYALDKNRAIEIVRNGNNDKNKNVIKEYYDTLNNENKKAKQKLRDLKVRLKHVLDTVPEIMVMGDLPRPRPTYILERGEYNNPSEEVFPNVPENILPFNKNLPKNRLGLSKWLFDKENPLTARVFVNRLWQMHFGKGLVETSNDFGNQGSLPTHPKLLDWLALTFQESGWDIKKMHKLIVMSATYQQSSKTNKKLLEIDVENTLLARGPSFRMSAEMIRDNALTVSGLIFKAVGGKSVFPYQPDGLWEELSNKPWRYNYPQESTKNLYRRSLYSFWKRTSPPPGMTIFDVAERGVCTVRRRQTSTPLQALVLLNDPQFIEASRVLSENLISKFGDNPLLQLQNAFKLCTGRTPDKAEMEILNTFYKKEIEHFSDEKENALAYIKTGQYPLKKELDCVKVAALTTVVNGIMNTTDSFTIR